jgi:hypothetical protein
MMTAKKAGMPKVKGEGKVVYLGSVLGFHFSA